MSRDPEVAVLVPTMTGLRFLPACLKALKSQRYPRFRVLVLHNAPGGDATTDWIGKTHPGVEILSLGRNHGFARAINLGLQATHEPLVALCNDDARPEPGWLEALVSALEEDPAGADLAFVCGKVVAEPDSGRLDSVGDGMSGLLLPYPIGRFEVDQGQYGASRTVLLASGCASLFRRALFEDTGLFEASFFAYMEDVDLGLRAALLGYRGGYVPGAVTRHIGSATTGGMINAVTVRLSTRNLVRVQVRNLPGSLILGRLHRLAAGHLYWFLKMAVKERHPLAWGLGFAAGLMRLPGDWVARRGLMRRRRIDDRTLRAMLDASAREVRESMRRKRRQTGRHAS